MSDSMQDLRDLTNKLDESFESVANILDDMPSLVCIWRGRRIHFVNKAFIKLLGVPRDDITDNRWVNFADPTDAQKLMQVVDEGASFEGLETRWRDKKGREVRIKWISSWPPTPQGYLLAIGTPAEGAEDGR